MTAATVSRSDDVLEFVTLMAGWQGFAIEIQQIRELRRWSPVTALPHAPLGVLGVINLRGTVVPIIDLAVRLALCETPVSNRAVFVVVRIGTRTLGLMVDSVSEIITVPRDQLRDVPSAMGAEAGQGVQSLIETEQELIRVIDLAAILPSFDPSEGD